MGFYEVFVKKRGWSLKILFVKTMLLNVERRTIASDSTPKYVCRPKKKKKKGASNYHCFIY